LWRREAVAVIWEVKGTWRRNVRGICGWEECERDLRFGEMEVVAVSVVVVVGGAWW